MAHAVVSRRRPVVEILFFACACLFSSVTRADVFISSSGNDASSGTSASAAVKTFHRALTIADAQLKEADCVINFSAGDFDAGDLKTGGIAISPGKNRLALVGTRAGPDAPAGQNTVLRGPLVFSRRLVVLKNLFIMPAVNAKPKSQIESAVETLLTISEAGPVTLSGCFFTGSADTAVRLKDCRDWKIENCVFHDIYRAVFVLNCQNGELSHDTLVDGRMGHGTNSLTTGRVEIRGSDHVKLQSNALSPRDPDGKILLLEGCGEDIQSDHNIWRGVIGHQYGTDQQSTWQNNFRTLDVWQAYTQKRWGAARDIHSLSEPLRYDACVNGVPRLLPLALHEYPGTGLAAPTTSNEPNATDFYGRPRTSDIGAINLEAKPDSTEPTVRPNRFTVHLPHAGRASVGVFDAASGNQLRTIVSGQLFSAGDHIFDWDGKNNSGFEVKPVGKLEYRAVLTPDGPLALDVAGPGCSWPANGSNTDLAMQPQENGEGMWCDSKGNLYRVAPYDEAGTTILSCKSDGSYRWRNWAHDGTLVTGDDKYIYVVGCSKHEKNEISVERYAFDGTNPVPWTEGVDALHLGSAADLTPTGLAVAGGKLYVSDGSHDRILIFSLGSTRVEKQLSFARAGALLALPDGSLVVCSRKSATDSTPAGQGSVVWISAKGEVVARLAKDVEDPVDVTTAPDGDLFVADGGIGNVQQVLRVRPKAGPTVIARIGAKGGYTKASPDPVVRPDRFMQINHIASAGNALWVGQKEPGYARNRLVRYDITPDAEPRLGLETLSLEGQNASAIDPKDPTKIYSADLFRYSVDLNSGSWKFDRNYSTTRWNTVREQVGCSTAAVFYVQGKKFFAATICNSPTTTSRTVLVFRFDGEQLVPCAAVGGKYFGPSFQEKDFDPGKSGQWVWLDRNGDGKLTPDEVTFVVGKQKDGMPFKDCTWGTYIERDGTIVWPGDAMHYLRPHGLDTTGKMAVYDFVDVRTVTYQNFPDRDERFEGRVDVDGTIFDLSTTKSQRMPPGYWGMGTVLTRLDPSGERQFSVSLDLTAKGLAIDENFVFVGSCFGPFINQYTKDGLLVRTFSWGHTSSQFGWFDFPTPINAVTDPKTSDSILTAEEQWFGRIMVFKVPGKIERFSGDVSVN